MKNLNFKAIWRFLEIFGREIITNCSNFCLASLGKWTLLGLVTPWPDDDPPLAADREARAGLRISADVEVALFRSKWTRWFSDLWLLDGVVVVPPEWLCWGPGSDPVSAVFFMPSLVWTTLCSRSRNRDLVESSSVTFLLTLKSYRRSQYYTSTLLHKYLYMKFFN